MSEIGKRIKSRREELGLTQDELAHILGYKGKSSIHKIEVGFADVPRAKAGDFARALDMPLHELMGEAPDAPDRKAMSFSYCLEQQMRILGYAILYDTEGNVILSCEGEQYETTDEKVKELEKRMAVYLSFLLDELKKDSRKIGGKN